MANVKKARKLIKSLKDMPINEDTEFWIAEWLQTQVQQERQKCVESIQLVIDAVEQLDFNQDLKEGCELARGAVEIRFYDEDEEDI